MPDLFWPGSWAMQQKFYTFLSIKKSASARVSSAICEGAVLNGEPGACANQSINFSI
jgi:hypothetical protein